MNSSTLCIVAKEGLAKNIDILVRDGIISVNEARSMLGLEPFATDSVVEIGRKCFK